MIDETNKLIKLDARFSSLLEEFGYPTYQKENQYFKSLLRSIIYQQLSGKAASKIHNRFLAIYDGDSHPTPDEVKLTSSDVLRSVGLSRQKISYIKNLCDYSLNNNIENIDQLSDDEISKQLTQIKGIGQWTVDMFLMFTLNRSDVMPYGDLAIQKGFKKFFNLDHLPSKKEMEEFSENWRPFRTLACWYLWETVEDEFDW